MTKILYHPSLNDFGFLTGKVFSWPAFLYIRTLEQLESEGWFYVGDL